MSLIVARVAGSPFSVDWSSKEAVIVYAKRFGAGMTVFKHPQRPNYNITHTSCPERFAGCKVVFQT